MQFFWISGFFIKLILKKMNFITVTEPWNSGVITNSPLHTGFHINLQQQQQKTEKIPNWDFQERRMHIPHKLNDVLFHWLHGSSWIQGS